MQHSVGRPPRRDSTLNGIDGARCADGMALHERLQVTLVADIRVAIVTEKNCGFDAIGSLAENDFGRISCREMNGCRSTFMIPEVVGANSTPMASARASRMTGAGIA